jgi:hypothetical protein
MRKRLFARLAWTGIASPLLMLLAYELDGTKLEWLALPFYAPGLVIAKTFVPGGAQPGHIPRYIQVAFGLNFVFIWIFLLVVAKLLEDYLQKRRENA